ncbi:DEAD/DEAH box helicase [Candidatus Parcubacteria bacterium]|nr:DEAD/DEAH box helicase [Candidatus Parcubacteria bacterium]
MSYTFRSNNKFGASKRFSTNGRRNNQSRGSRRPMGQYIDPARFVKTANLTLAEEYVPRHSFTDFAISQGLKDNLATKGYEIPSPIQDQAIPAALKGQDVIGIASTGTGKTAAFAVPIIQKLTTDNTSAALIIAPTRELAQQIEQECRELGKGSGLSGALLIGGSSMGTQLRDLKYNPRIVIGTPGRTKDHIERGTLKLQKFNLVVLDEVDRMLDMGFIHDVTTILDELSENRQSFFFSATMDVKIRNLISRFTKDPFTVTLKSSGGSENVHQNVVRYAGNSDRMEKLHNILLKEEVEKVIVFDETQRNVERLSNELLQRGFSAGAIHGGKTQGHRERALSRFKKSEVTILVATDVAARGIDVVDITHVINFSLPKGYDDYIHRIGRAGRAGRIGHALTFITD